MNYNNLRVDTLIDNQVYNLQKGQKKINFIY